MFSMFQVSWAQFKMQYKHLEKDGKHNIVYLSDIAVCLPESCNSRKNSNLNLGISKYRYVPNFYKFNKGLLLTTKSYKAGR